MLERFARIPIFRRLFYTCLLTALIPDLTLLFMGFIYSRVLLAHGMSVEEIGPLTLGTILAFVSATGVGVFLGYLMNRTITQPLSHLATVARRIQQGETNARAPITGRDEIAVVASLVNRMLDQIVHAMQDIQDQRDRLQTQVEKLVGEVSGVGEGNLCIQAEVTLDTLGVLADSFNYMVEALSTLVRQVKGATMEVEQATSSMQQEMQRLVTTAEAQLQQIAQASRTIKMMVQSTLNVVERTQNLDREAREAKRATQQGRQTVQQTLAGIDHLHRTARQTAAQVERLAERSREIDEVVNVLEDIAHHISRLALDAAIQVALAGNTKTGFGAVADDIRRLSEQTKLQLTTVSRNVKSVRTEIDTVAGTLQQGEQETATGARHVQETGESLSTIFTLVEQQASEIASITTMTRDLFQATHEIAQNMEEISDMTKHNSSSTQTVAQNMQHLTLLAKQLRVSVEVFQVQEASMLPYQEHVPVHLK